MTALHPPADGQCSDQTGDTSNARQAIITYDTTACGSDTYRIIVSSLSGSGTYWLDLSTGGAQPIKS